MKKTAKPPIRLSEEEMLRTRDHRTALLFPDLSENPWPWAKPARRPVPAPPPKRKSSGLTTLELCAGAGGQALGYHEAGIEHLGLLEIDKHACTTLRMNHPEWNVIEGDLKKFNDGARYKGVDIISGGLPCPPFSVAGKQLGERDERNLFPFLINLVDQVRPKAVMIENVRGILDAVFVDYRNEVRDQLRALGYTTGWNLMQASSFGVPQLRPRVVFVGLRDEYRDHFAWPTGTGESPRTVGETLHDLMAANGWEGAAAWRDHADEIAPTVVGGSHKHGGPDLGPTRARRAWASLGVDGLGIADHAPASGFQGMPRLTVRMVARIQGFPDHWQFSGGKTASYRQVGNAFPPPFARAVAESLKACLSKPRLVRVAG